MFKSFHSFKKLTKSQTCAFVLHWLKYSQTSIIRSVRDRRIIGSSNDRNREFSDIFGITWMLSENAIVLPEFATSTRVSVKYRNFCQSIKENELFEGCGLISSYALQV